MVRKCVVCKKKMDRISGIYCRECLAKHNKDTRELKRKYRKQGLCPNCGNKPLDGYVRCEKCHRVLQKASRSWSNGGYDPLDLELDLIKLKQELENENN